MHRLPELNPRGEWFTYQHPFRHIRAEGVFREESYRRLENSFMALRDGTPANGNRQLQFRKSQPAYDALLVAMQSQLSSRFAPLFDRRWIDFLASLLGVPALPQVDGALHHIPRHSRSGWIHNDFCSAWFDAQLTGDVVFPDRNKCEYFSGTPRTPDAQPREYVRAATTIFYLHNDGWRRGAGGETGLYSAMHDVPGKSSTVPPLNNSLLLFECSPHSYHRLIENPGSPRNSIILWLHCSVEDAQSRWGRAVTRRMPK